MPYLLHGILCVRLVCMRGAGREVSEPASEGKGSKAVGIGKASVPI
jgi:hypothetical protein